MAPRTGVKLPGWAKLIRPKTQSSSSMTKRQPLNTKDEEAYMRKRCYHILSQEMEGAMEDAMKEALAPSLATINNYLDAAAPPSELRSSSSSSGPTSNSSQHSRKRQRLFSPAPSKATSATATAVISEPTTTPDLRLLAGGLLVDSQLFDQQQEPQTPHDPLLLPIIVLQQGPSFGLDRKAQADTIVASLRTARHNSAVVKVQQHHQRGGGRSSSNASSNNNNTTGWMMQELVRQCHSQCPVLTTEPTLQRRIVKRKKKMACTFSDMLLLWAQHVTCYDEIVIVFDADESFYSTELQDFLHVLAARRSEQGIPLSVVMMGPHEGRRAMELRSTQQGYAGFMIRSVSLPSPDRIVDQFWKRLYFKRQFPVMFPPAVLAAIRTSFTYHQSSFRGTLHKFQQALAYHFTQRGSILTVASDPSIASELWQRLAWFCVAQRPEGEGYCRDMLVAGEADDDVDSARILQVVSEVGTRHQEAQLALQLMASVSQTKEEKGDNDKLNLFHPTFLYLLDNVTRKEMLQQLVHLRQHSNTSNNVTDVLAQDKPGHKALLTKYVICETRESACLQEQDTEKHQLTREQNLVNELIILVGNCRDGDSLSEIEQLLDEILARWIYHRSDSSTEEPSAQREWLAEVDWTSVAESFSSEPRHQTVAALLELQVQSPPNGLSNKRNRSVHLSLANIAGTMYRMIHDRVAATQEDWYEEFWQKAIVEAGEVVSREKSFALFSFGLRYLKQCGFISEKLRVGSRSAIIYERAKLVWCGGG